MVEEVEEEEEEEEEQAEEGEEETYDEKEWKGCGDVRWKRRNQAHI